MESVKLLRIKAVNIAVGTETSATYANVAAGLLTRPIKLSSRCVRWPSNEIEVLVHARIRGLDNDAIRALVDQLHLKRAVSGQPAGGCKA